ncbi:MAG: hypothetical protein FJ012_02405 [Chloroflexi bacterium]|nr:hypothetical protein [Chloroflexota bacterium]
MREEAIGGGRSLWGDSPSRPYGDKSDRPALPQGWVWTRLGEISTLEAGNPAPQGENCFIDGRYPFVRVQDMGSLENNVYIHDTRNHLNDMAIRKLRLVPKGAVLFTKSGMSTLLNQRAILGRDMYVVSHIGIAMPLGRIPSEWLYYWLKTVDFKELTHATTLPSLQLSKVQEIHVPLPPLPEQHRIVAKIEELFTRLDAGVAVLKKVKAQLKAYRRAVLRDAFEGKLTAEWRQARKGELEPASVLLERIKKERDRNAPVGARSPRPYTDTSNLPTLPEGWVWANIGGIGEVSGGLTKSSKRDIYSRKMPYLRVANVYAGELQLNDIRSIGVKEDEVKKVTLKKGDLLIVEGNGSRDQIGRVALWDGGISPCVHQNHIIKARFQPTEISRYALYWLLSADGREQITRVASSTSGLYTLSISKVLFLPIPLPSLLEQARILDEIERRFSIADEAERVVEQSLKQAERLRQSILKRAFEGKLVPQDPTDEPAEELLKRIQREKSNVGTSRRSPLRRHR